MNSESAGQWIDEAADTVGDESADRVRTSLFSRSRFKWRVNRTATSALLTVCAVALLGVLLLLSTSADEAAHHRIDHVLRQLRDAALVAEREVIDARSANVDNGVALSLVIESLKRGMEQLTHDLTPIYPPEGSISGQLTPQLVRWFNSIDASRDDSADPAAVWSESSALDQSTRWFIERLDSFSNQNAAYLAASTGLADDSRQFVNELRERGQNGAADALFQATDQALDRVQRASAVDLDQVTTLASRLQAQSGLTDAADLVRADNLAVQMRRLVTAKRLAEQDATEIVSGRFKTGISELRDIVTRDYLYRLASVNDARVLLNVYTVLLLLVLGYFGYRLQRSYKELDASHSDLETANASLEVRVQERTADLEKAYRDLQESQVQLVQAEKMSSLGQLVAGIMHEINTPLLYVMNNAEVTAQNVEELRHGVEAASRVTTALEKPQEKVELKAALEHLQETVDPNAALETIDEIATLATDSREGLQQISQLVQSLKDFSRLDRAAEDTFNVCEGLEKTLTITRNLLKYGIKVEKHFDRVPAIVCSPSRINQVFINLITNAVQAMDGKGVLTISTRMVGDWVQVEMRDTGCGIAKENLNRILDPFFTTKPVGQGTGLGLSIVKKIIDEHGGRLDVTSEVGVGSAFTITLPVRRARAQEAA